MTGHRALLADLQSRGVKVIADGQKLRCRGPRGAMKPADLTGLRAHKAEILAELQPAADPGQAGLIGHSTDPILETRHELGAVRLWSRRFACELWVALDPSMASELRAEESQHPAPRPVLDPADVTRLKGKSAETIQAALVALTVFPGSGLIQ